MKRWFQGQVNPRYVAITILVLLVAVQWAWWRGLVAKPKPGPPGRMMGGGGGMALFQILGREDVQVDTLAGDSEPGDADGPGYRARFDGPTGIAIDSAGALYVADTRNHRIRRVGRDGKTSTLAGSEPGYADGPALSARFNAPCGVAVAPDGAVYVADTGNHRIRCIRGGQVTTLAGGAPGMADGAGAAARFNLPCALAYAANGRPRIVVADTGNRRLREVDLTGRVTTLAVLPGAPTAVLAGAAPVVAVPQAGLIQSGAQALHNVPVDAGAQSEAPQAKGLGLSRPVALYPAPGGWYVIDAGHAAIFHVRGGKAEVLAGRVVPGRPMFGWHDTTGDRASLGMAGAIAADGAGHLYVAETTNNVIRRITLPAGG